VTCDTCEGTGEVAVQLHGKRGPGLGYQDAERPCYDCGGTGLVPDDDPMLAEEQEHDEWLMREGKDVWGL